MQTAILERHETGDQGTFGRLLVPGLQPLYSGELPWRDNASNISCIPEGKYKGVWTYSPHFKRYMYLIIPVDGRAGIRVHLANVMGDLSKGFKCELNGCISLGLNQGYINKQKALFNSATAIRLFETFMNKQTFPLEVRSWAH